jgi:hypothetical protein
VKGVMLSNDLTYRTMILLKQVGKFGFLTD